MTYGFFEVEPVSKAPELLEKDGVEKAVSVIENFINDNFENSIPSEILFNEYDNQAELESEFEFEFLKYLSEILDEYFKYIEAWTTRSQIIDGLDKKFSNDDLYPAEHRVFLDEDDLLTLYHQIEELQTDARILAEDGEKLQKQLSTHISDAARGQVGHNNPPSMISELEEVVKEAVDGLRAFEKESERSEDQVQETIANLSETESKFKSYAATKGDRFVDGSIDSISGKVGPALYAILLAFIAKFSGIIEALSVLK